MGKTFESQLSTLVSKQLCGSADDIGFAIERLTNALGLAIAVSCGGEIARADDMMMGVEGYLAECVADNARLAAFMATARPTPSTTNTGEP